MRGTGMDPATAPRVPVVAAVARADTMEAFLDASSTLEAEDTIEVVSQATGVVVEVFAEEGDSFRKDDVLARLAYEELELAERRARSELERLQADFARAEELKREELIPEEDYQQVSFDLRRSDLDWQQKKLELERTRILSPISGTVASRNIRVGDLVRQNDAVYSVVDFGSLVAPVFIPEKYLSDLRIGQHAVLTAPALANTRVQGRVIRISPVVDSQSGTVRVIVEPGRDSRLRPGMFANVQLVLDRHENVVVVPKKAILYEDEQPHLFVIEEGKAVKRALAIGYQDEERAEIVDGVHIDDIVVVVGQSALKEGSLVRAEDENGRPIDTGAPQPGS
jgi:membrane fusion protein (multidrug efflux system)